MNLSPVVWNAWLDGLHDTLETVEGAGKNTRHRKLRNWGVAQSGRGPRRP